MLDEVGGRYGECGLVPPEKHAFYRVYQVLILFRESECERPMHGNIGGGCDRGRGAGGAVESPVLVGGGKTPQDGWRIRCHSTILISMTHLTSVQLAELRADLDRQLAKLIKSMVVTDAALEPVALDQTAVGRLSRIDSLQNQGLTRNLREREEVKLALIQKSLERMEKGTYGACTTCGNPVPFERLVVFPEAPTCADC